MPLEDIFEQAIEGFNGLGAEAVKDSSDPCAWVSMGIRTSFGSNQEPVAQAAGTEDQSLFIVVMAVAQDVADFSRQLPNKSRGHLGIVGVGDGQFSRQREPEDGDSTGEMEFPAISPAVVARFGPVGLGVNAAVRH